MSFEKVSVHGSGGVDIPPPRALAQYCEELLRVPPSVEVYLGDPEYDLGTLHSSLAFRVATVSLAVSIYDGFKIDWTKPTQHSIDDTGKKWTDAPGLALKYEVADTTRALREQGRSITPVYISIQFELGS